MSDEKLPTAIPEMYFSEREYYALRELFGIISSFDKCAGELEKRVKLIPGAWRDYRMIQSVALKLITKILPTVPQKKRKQIEAELYNTSTIITVKRGNIPVQTEDYDDNITYVSQRALERITERCVEFNCMFCEKCGKEAKRCQIRQDIESTYHFELFTNFPKDRICPFAGGKIEDPSGKEE